MRHPDGSWSWVRWPWPPPSRWGLLVRTLYEIAWRRQIWQTAVLYHLIHALGLFVIAGVAHLIPESAGPRIAGWAMLVGILLFSGSLYVLVLSSTRWLGAVTPLGGIAFIGAWVTLALSAWRG